MKAEAFIIISSSDLVRHGLQSLIQEAIGEFSHICSFNQVSDIKSLISENKRAVLLLDDDLPKHQDIFSYLNLLHQKPASFRVIILSHYLSVSYIQRLLNNGVYGFMYKQDTLEEILTVAIKTVLMGSVFLSPSASILPYENKQYHNLNDTDLQVLQLLASGYNVQEIAMRVNIVARSVYRIRSKLRAYLGVRTNEQIVDAARKRDLIV